MFFCFWKQGNIIATGSTDNTAKLWDVETVRLLLVCLDFVGWSFRDVFIGLLFCLLLQGVQLCTLAKHDAEIVSLHFNTEGYVNVA